MGMGGMAGVVWVVGSPVVRVAVERRRLKSRVERVEKQFGIVVGVVIMVVGLG